MKVLALMLGFLLTLAHCVSEIVEEEGKERIYGLKKCSGSGCPYAASWLAHVNLYRRIPWWLDSTKMEAASFNIFDRAKLKFQVQDPDAYFVHHMSMFEHLNHKTHGFAVAKNKTLSLSRAAFAGECDNLVINKSKDYVAFVPFFGGRPPGVTKDLAVKSIGQGNSLVDSYTKALQTMATVCSCLKYYGYVVIGVARDEDRILVNDMLHQKLNADVRHHTNVVQFQMVKPANLPFHMLAWGQQYVRIHNCHKYYSDLPSVVGENAAQTSGTAKQKRVLSDNNNSTISTTTVVATESTNVTPNATQTHHNSTLAVRGGVSQVYIDYFNPSTVRKIDYNRLPKSDVYEICAPNAITAPVGGPINVVYLKKWDINRHKAPRAGAHHHKNSTTISANTTTSVTTGTHAAAIKYVYFTESDQVVRYDGMETLRALTAASNESTFFVGKRREKARDSDPNDYMGSLNIWRECGTGGYSISWPKESVVRFD
eukprot:gene12089-14008_t